MNKGITAHLMARSPRIRPAALPQVARLRSLSSVGPVAGGERPGWMLSAQQRVVLIPFVRSKAARWRQRNRRLPDAESPAESEDRTRLTPVDVHRDKTQESLGTPIQIVARRACWGVEEGWRKAEETEGVSGRTERLEWIHLELLPRACAIGRAHELHPPHGRFVSLPGVCDGSDTDREIPCERWFGKRLGIRIGFDRDVDPPRSPQKPEVQPHGRHPSLPPSIRNRSGSV